MSSPHLTEDGKDIHEPPISTHPYSSFRKRVPVATCLVPSLTLSGCFTSLFDGELQSWKPHGWGLIHESRLMIVRLFLANLVWSDCLQP